MATYKAPGKKAAKRTVKLNAAERAEKKARNRLRSDEARVAAHAHLRIIRSASVAEYMKEVDFTKVVWRSGQPYNKAIGELICKCRAVGMRQQEIVRMPNMPSLSTLFRWIQEHEDFSRMYDKANISYSRLLVENMEYVAEDGRNDTCVDEESGQRVVNWDVVARSKLRVDTMRWAAGKFAQHLFGDKVMQEHTGKDGAPLYPTTFDPKKLKNLTDEELAILARASRKLGMAQDDEL